MKNYYISYDEKTQVFIFNSWFNHFVDDYWI